MSETGDATNTPRPANDPNASDPAAAPEAGGPNAEAAAAALAERVNELEAENQSLKDERLRALAEAENARRRAQKDREEANRYGAANLARDVVSVADNLARALAAMPETDGDGPIAKLAEGVAMVERELAGALERHGVKAVGEVGEAFDHNFCQAVFEVETTEHPPGAIAQVMQKGYVLHDRLLRPAMVGVAKEPAELAAPNSQSGGRGGQVDETA